MYNIYKNIHHYYRGVVRLAEKERKENRTVRNLMASSRYAIVSIYYLREKRGC